jgi:outer membrane lipoprotein SlyB
MSNAVFCISSDEKQVGRIVADLKLAGFLADDISVLLPDTSGSHDFAHESHTKTPEGAVAGMTAGGMFGGTVGVLAGLGVLMLPGIGPLLAVGPLLMGLSGLAVGAALGGLSGALIGLGIPEIEAKIYADKIAAGNILISAHTTGAEQEHKARMIFKNDGATDISVMTEAAAPRMAS